MFTINRRDLLKYSLSTLFSPFLSSCNFSSPSFTKGQLENYIQFNLFGAPSRWNLDLLLNDNKKYIPHPYIGDFINTKGDIFLKTSPAPNRNGPTLELPYIWEKPLNAKGDLLKEHLSSWTFIRGTNIGQDGHERNNKLLIKFPDDINSLNAKLAQTIAKTKPRLIPSISYQSFEGKDKISSSEYYSSEGVPNIEIPYYVNNPIEFIFDDYKKADINKNDIRHKLREAWRSEYSELNTSLQRLNPKQIEHAVAYYDRALNKYKKLLLFCKKENLFDEKILLPKAKTVLNHKDNLNKFKTYTYGNFILTNNDLDNLCKSGDYSSMVKQFALIETLLINKLTVSQLICLNPIQHIFCDVVDITTKKEIKNFHLPSITFDAHSVGSTLNTFFTSHFYFVFSSFLNELLKKSTKEGIFNKTLFHITSEFDREPSGLSGSDHGFNGQTNSFISGVFKETNIPTAIGNIYASSKERRTINMCTGTWGHGAPVPEMNNRELNYNNIRATICNLFAVKDKSLEKNSILKIKGERLISKASAQRII